MGSRRIAVLALILGLAAAAVGLIWHRSTAKRPRSTSGTSQNSDAGAAHQPRRRSHDSVGRDPDPVGSLRLEGQVIDADQHGVGGATVAITTNPVRTVTTEDDGSFAIDGLLPRTYQIGARKDQGVSTTTTLRLRETTEPVILRLHRALVVALHVVDDVTEAPIVGAVVTGTWLMEEELETGADGVVLLTGTDWWSWIEVEADGYASASLSLTARNDPGGYVDRPVRLAHGATVNGVVLGADGQPAADVMVWAQGQDQTGGTTYSDDAGKFEVTLPSGAFTLSAFAEGSPIATSELLELDGVTPRAGVVLRLSEGVHIRGEVVDERGAPVALAEVHAMVGYSGADTSTDATGHFDLRGLGRGDAELMATSDDRSSKRASVDTSAGDVEGVRLELRDGTITGVVVDDHGEPVPEAIVQSLSDDTNAAFSMLGGDGKSIADSGGRFVIGPMPPGDYRVWAAWPGKDPRGSLDFDHMVTASTGSRDVKVVLPAAGEVTGIVMLDGAPVTDYSVAGGWWAGGAPPAHVRAADGRFTLTGLVPGKLGIVIVGDGFATQEIEDVEVLPGKRVDLGRIEVHGGRTVRGRVVDESGGAIAGAMVVISAFISPDGQGLGIDDDPIVGKMRHERSTVTGADGTFSIADVSKMPNQDVLYAMADRPRVGRSSRIQLTDDQTDVELVLHATGAIGGTLTGGSEMTEIYAVLADGGPDLGGYADLGGRYWIGAVVPGRYYVSAGTSDDEGSRGTPTLVVDVEAGKTASADLVFPSGPITLVVHVGARACDEVSLQLVDAPIEHDEIVGRNCTAPDLELMELPPGAYKICLRNDSCVPVTVTASPARQTIDLSK